MSNTPLHDDKRRYAAPMPETLDAICSHLQEEELTVLTRIAGRLLMGQKTYGPLDIANDGRDFMKELREELDDAIVYSAIAQLKAELDEPIPYKLKDPEPNNVVGIALEDSRPIAGTEFSEVKVLVGATCAPVRTIRTEADVDAMFGIDNDPNSIQSISKSALRSARGVDVFRCEPKVEELESRVLDLRNQVVDGISSAVKLEQQVANLQAQLAKVTRDHDTMFANLTSVQAKCTTQEEELRALRKRPTMTFNGPAAHVYETNTDLSQVVFTKVGK